MDRALEVVPQLVAGQFERAMLKLHAQPKPPAADKPVASA
jgi:hypothetical protein